MKFDPFSIIEKYYVPGTLAYRILVQHSTLVTSRALQIATRWNERNHSETVNLELLEAGGMLHDIGIVKVQAPYFGCFGQLTYLEHTVAGYDILIDEGLPEYANFCLTHTGVGISHDEIRDRQLPLSLEHSYIAESLEQKILSYADLFYSKNPETLCHELPSEIIRKKLAVFGERHVKIFDERQALFEGK